VSLSKIPRVPRGPLDFQELDIATWHAPLYRIHRITGTYAVKWNDFRIFGPISSCRWDHHPSPIGIHPEHGILYAASSPLVAFAEVFQNRRMIKVDGNRMLTGWEPVRPLRLIDLTSNWPVRNGAGRALVAGPRSTTRAWAAAIFNQAPEFVDGILADSTLSGGNTKVVVLWQQRCADAFPATPALAASLDSPAVAGLVVDAAKQTGYHIG